MYGITESVTIRPTGRHPNPKRELAPRHLNSPETHHTLATPRGGSHIAPSEGEVCTHGAPRHSPPRTGNMSTLACMKSMSGMRATTSLAAAESGGSAAFAISRL